MSYPAAAISNELAGAKDGDARWVVAGGVGVGVGVGVSRLRSTAGRDRVSGGTDPPAEERGTQPEELGERLDWTPKWWSWASSCSDAGGHTESTLPVTSSERRAQMYYGWWEWSQKGPTVS